MNILDILKEMIELVNDQPKYMAKLNEIYKPYLLLIFDDLMKIGLNKIHSKYVGKNETSDFTTLKLVCKHYPDLWNKLKKTVNMKAFL